MLGKVLKKIVGTSNDRELRQMGKVVKRINVYEDELKQLSDTELKGQTNLFREQLANGDTLDGILPKAFAVAWDAPF